LKEITIPSSVNVISAYDSIDDTLGYVGYDEYLMPIKMEDFTIYGVKGSVGYQYAKQNGFNFIEIEGELPTSGIYTSPEYSEADSWEFDESSGILTITGDWSEEAWFYLNNYTRRCPWYAFRNDIQTVKGDGFEFDGDTVRIQTVLDTVELTPHDTIYCYDCSSEINLTEVMCTYTIKDSDKEILQEFIDENLDEYMTNTEKIKYTMDWLHENVTYTLTGSLPNSLAECGFVQNAGQCLQYNGALAYMLDYMGYDANLIFLKNDSGWQHYTCLVKINNKVYEMEVGNKGLDDGSHYMPQSFLSLVTEITPEYTTIDILNLKKYLLGISIYSPELNINHDGDVNILDLITMLNDLNR